MIYQYSINEEDFENSYKLETHLNHLSFDMISDIAEDAADDFHTYHDGWEYSWPIDFYIFTVEGKLLGTFTVERESSPVFYANKKK